MCLWQIRHIDINVYHGHRKPFSAKRTSPPWQQIKVNCSKNRLKKFRKDAQIWGEITFSNTRWHKSPFAPLWELAALLSNRYTLHFALSLEGDACEQAKLSFEAISGKIIFQYRISGMVEVKRGAGEAFVSRGKSEFGIWLQQNILLATVELLYSLFLS